MRVMVEEGIILDAGDADRNDVISALESLFPRLISDVDRRRQMASAGQRLVDGRGFREGRPGDRVGVGPRN